MQILDKVKDCNGCGACIVGCKDYCIKMVEDEKGLRTPLINEGGCNKCNNCVLYCPLYMPVDLPEFAEYYEYKDEFWDRDMPKVYRETLRQAKTGEPTEFVGTLCQIAGLKSLMGDKIRPNVTIRPLYCDPEAPKRPACGACKFVERWR